jgi:Ion channel
MKLYESAKGLPLWKDRCFFLMLSMITVLLLYHYVWADPALTLTIYFLLMASGIYAVSSSRRHAVIAVIIGALAVTLLLVRLAHPSYSLALAAFSLLIAYFCYMLVIVLLYVVRGPRVTRDKIFGAISVYFLIAFLWTFLYRLLFILDPGSFTGNKPLAAGTVHVEFLYYSFGVISTLGFSDIQATSDFARAFSILETITGNFYIAVLISRLVSMYQSDSEE